MSLVTAPARLPGVVDIAGGLVRLRPLPTPELAAAIVADPRTFLAAVAEPDDWAACEAAVRSPVHDAIDIAQLRAAGAGVAARVCGLEATMSGWRTAFRLCGSLFASPPAGWAVPVAAGVDPDRAPLWVVVAAVYAQGAQGKDEEKLAAWRRELAAPIPGEEYWRDAMPVEQVERPDPRSRAERRKRAYRNRGAVAALRSGKLR